MRIVFQWLCCVASGAGYVVAAADEWLNGVSRYEALDDSTEGFLSGKNNRMTMIRFARMAHCTLSTYLHFDALGLVPPPPPRRSAVDSSSRSKKDDDVDDRDGKASSTSGEEDKKKEEGVGAGITGIIPTDPRRVVPIVVNLVVTAAGLFAFSPYAKTINSKNLLLSSESSFDEASPLSDVLWMHVGLFAFNLITLSAALMLRWDRIDSVKALNDVTSAKYHFKSL